MGIEVGVDVAQFDLRRKLDVVLTRIELEGLLRWVELRSGGAVEMGEVDMGGVDMG